MLSTTQDHALRSLRAAADSCGDFETSDLASIALGERDSQWFPLDDFGHSKESALAACMKVIGD